MLLQGQVGSGLNLSANAGQGQQLNLRQAGQGDLIVSELMPRYAAAAIGRQKFYGSLSAGVTTTASLTASAVVAPFLYNPVGSGVNVIVTKVGVRRQPRLRWFTPTSVPVTQVQSLPAPWRGPRRPILKAVLFCHRVLGRLFILPPSPARPPRLVRMNGSNCPTRNKWSPRLDNGARVLFGGRQMLLSLYSLWAPTTTGIPAFVRVFVLG